MPDPLRMLMASGGAALVSGTFVLISSLSFFHASPFRARTLWIVGIGVGFLVGCTLLGRGPRGSFAEDIDRLFLWVIPATIIVEIAAGHSQLPQWGSWLLRLVVAGSVAPLLLKGTVYLADLGGPGSREWSTAQAAFILTALPILVILGWCVLCRLHAGPSGRLLEILLATTSIAAGVTVMLSGYLSGGQLGLPLAGGYFGALAVSFFQRGPAENRPLGIVVVGLASVLMLGCFFGTLHPAAALLLFSAPVVGGMGAGLPLKQFARPWRWGMGIVLYLVLVGGVLWHVQRIYREDAATPSNAPSNAEPSVNDYLNFGRPS